MAYEILSIITPEADEKAQAEIGKNIKASIQKENGKILSESNLGTKRFAYPMAKNETGTYLTITCELSPDKVKPIRKELKANDQLIRYFIFKAIEPKVAKVAKVKKVVKVDKVQKIEKVQDKVEKVESTTTVKADDRKSEIDKIEKIEKPKKKVVAVKPKEKPAIAVEIEGEQDRLKKLDEKLDEILKD